MVEYFFRITESPDAEIGSKTEGLADPNPYFDVPAGSLRDGVTYYWHAWTKDPTHWRFPDWVRSFRVDLRLGAGPQATDSFGPASVNLATGNLNLGVASPSFATLAGPVGLSFTYNSLAEDNTGLTGTYYNDPAATRSFAGKTPAMTRRDTDVNFEWGNEVGPGGGVAGTNFLVRWEGTIATPTSGNYWIGAGSDDGVRIFVDDQAVVDHWQGPTPPDGIYDQHRFFDAGVPRRIRVEYHQASGRALFTLIAAGPFGPGGTHAATIVPASWLGAEPTPLPKGWSLSAGVGGDGGYSSARGTGATATLTDTSGRSQPFPPATPPHTPTTGRPSRGPTPARPAPAPPRQACCAAPPVQIPTGPAPRSPGWRSTVYDAAGRTVATRIGTGPWSCTSFDARGRPTSVTIPASATAPARTVSYNWAVGNNPLVTSLTDPAGTISTTVDLLGRPVSYTDVHANTTTSTYDQAGRLVATATPARGWSSGMDYDDAGRPTTQRLDGAVVATAAYDPAGELASVDYPLGSGGNGTSLAAIGRDQAGRVSALTWQGDLSAIATDAVVRSRSGRVLTDTVDGELAHTFDYDNAGRLEGATVPGHDLYYAYDATGGCGPLAGAGRNTNRTRLVDNGVATTYCYDAADRLVSSSDPSVGAIAYDARGNTTTLGPQALAYDGADRHSATTTGSTTVTYDRDATDRIVARRVNNTLVATYGYAGPGDSPAFVNANTGVLGVGVYSRFVALIGGASIHKGATGGDIWSYPNIHGDVMATANALGLPSPTYH